jgi:hypothetical protein
MIKLKTALSGAEAKEYCLRMYNAFLDSPSVLKKRALRERGWIAVPVADYITEEYAEHLEAAVQGIESRKGLAFATEPPVGRDVYWVTLNSMGLNHFDAHCMLSSYLLVGEREDFLILEEGDYFYVIAGFPEFVAEAVGGSVTTAREEFWKYADNDGRWGRATRKWLMDTARRYQELTD